MAIIVPPNECITFVMFEEKKAIKENARVNIFIGDKIGKRKLQMVEEPCLAGPKIQMAQGFGPYTPGAGVLSEDSLPAAHVTLLRSSLHTALRCASHISLHTRD